MHWVLSGPLGVEKLTVDRGSALARHEAGAAFRFPLRRFAAVGRDARTSRC